MQRLLRVTSPAASIASIGYHRFFRTSAILCAPAAAAAAVVVTAKPKKAGPQRVLVGRPAFAPLRTAADVARYFRDREALRAKRAASPPAARPVVELKQAEALKARGRVVFPVQFRAKHESKSELRERQLVPGSLSTREPDGTRTILSISVPRRLLLDEMKKNTIHCRVFELQLSGVPGVEGTLTYKATCTRVAQPPLRDGPQGVDFVLFEPYLPTRVIVPIQYEGVEDCVGKKHGGLVFFGSDRVNAWWSGDENIPEKFVVDVIAADIGVTFHESDLNWPVGLRPAHRYNHLLCSVRGTSIKEDEAEGGDAAAGGDAATTPTPGGGAAPAAGAAAAPATGAKAGAAAGDDKKAPAAAADKKK